ncbi:flagellar protein [Rhizobium sp. L1K21]|uniref:flagellar protein n=1 Tax=Rhizobium sp. L1K21 TaxID=2954933 RepID=UPI00209335C4|nr:flagellar protein [Rhizobium sp. L1K21]MCO6187129.1 flagellar protein [Rhizobium sp. L1K21]
MTDLDADEPVPPIRRNRGRDVQKSDLILSIAGVAMAAFAAFFPWYVFFNRGDFEVRGNGGHMVRDLPEAPFRNVVSVSPIASIDNDDKTASPDSVDQVTTATVPEETSALAREPHEPEALNQPLPGGASFKLLHATSGQALIQDSTGMYIVGVGDVLPDNSRLSTIENRDGNWALITSNGEVIR